MLFSAASFAGNNPIISPIWVLFQVLISPPGVSQKLRILFFLRLATCERSSGWVEVLDF